MAQRTRTKVETGGSDAPEFDFSKGDLTGTYQGAREVKTQYGEKKIHSFKLESSGEEVIVWGRAMLNNALAKVEVGTLVDVVLTGRKIKTKGGGSATEFEVYTLA